MLIAYVVGGGVLGTLARYFLGGWTQQALAPGSSFPAGTLIINLLGSFLLGFIMRFATGSLLISPELRGALTVGFCGAFTTMSTFSYESVRLIGGGEYLRALAYGGATVFGCFIATVAGIALATKVL